MVAISLFQSERDRDPVAVDLEWADLADLLTKHERRADKAGPAWIPGAFREGTGRKAGASASNMVGISVAVFDLDDMPEGDKRRPMTPDEWLAALGRIESAGYRAIVHSSYRYTPAKPKGRVILPLSRPVSAAEWPHVRSSLNASLSLNADPATANFDRLYYLPAAPDGAPVFAGQTSGDRVVDVDELLTTAKVEAVAAQIETIANQKTATALAAAQAMSSEPVDLDFLRKLLKQAEGKNASTLKKILRGESLADQGGRDMTLNAACSAARFAVPATTPTAALVEIFRESVSRMEHLPGEDWIEECRKKLDRHQERRILNDAARQAQQEDMMGRFRRESARSGQSAPKRGVAAESDTPGASEPQSEIMAAMAALAAPVGVYAPADLAEWAAEQGCSTQEDFQNRWIVTKGTAHYLFVEGRYAPPIPRENLEHSIVRDLSRAPVELTAVTQKGDRRMREIRAVLHDYSTVARHIEASLSLQRSFYEPTTQTFFEAVCPLRKLNATEHPEIQRWIDLLDPSGKLTDWIAAVSRLDRQSCAVYLDGPGGVGKTLLASGLARLWTTGAPSEIARVLEGFNESLVGCPLILADESLPQRKGITAELRRLVGSTKRTLNRKFLPAAPLEGAIRLVIAGNNDRILETGEELSTNDLEALAGRFYYLQANKDPADYLESLGGPPRITAWIERDWLAEHSLWLRNTRVLPEGGRFLVEGNASEFHRHLAMGSGVAGVVCEWLARFLADPNPGTGLLTQVGSGELWVNTEAMSKETAWSKYVPSNKVPSANSIGRALRGMSFAAATVEISGRHITYHRIAAPLILSWVDRLQIGDLQAVKARLEAHNLIVESQKVAP